MKSHSWSSFAFRLSQIATVLGLLLAVPFAGAVLILHWLFSKPAWLMTPEEKTEHEKALWH